LTYIIRFSLSVLYSPSFFILSIFLFTLLFFFIHLLFILFFLIYFFTQLRYSFLLSLLFPLLSIFQLLLHFTHIYHPNPYLFHIPSLNLLTHPTGLVRPRPPFFSQLIMDTFLFLLRPLDFIVFLTPLLFNRLRFSFIELFICLPLWFPPQFLGKLLCLSPF
jgi:hypothetical protein